ncbi:MAG TPA: hypothetical protein VEB41_16470 [Burkholderiales bacterium]|nr:hypothetical protein [Burkholderiales bacterium]
MSNDRSLREKIRQVLRARRFPDRSPDHIWGGLSTGSDCAVCEKSIAKGDVELEVQFSSGGYFGSYIVHLRCFSMLEDERQNLPSDGRIPQNRVRGAGATTAEGEPA